MPSTPSPPDRDVQAARTTWATVDLTAIVAGDQIDPPPNILSRTDGERLIYAGKAHVLQGEPESGKGWLALEMCRDEIKAGHPVVYIDFEDGPQTAVARLRALGVEDHEIMETFHYIRPDERLSDQARDELFAAVDAIRPSTAVIDGVTEGLTLHGWDIKDNGDVAKWLALLPRPLAATGAAVVQIDHVTKDRETRGRYAIGAQHKLAGVDVAYTLEVIDPFGRGRDGLVKVSVTKDRPGHVRQLGDGKTVAMMHLSSHDDGAAVTVELRPPARDGEGFRPTRLMEKVSRAIEREPGITKGEIRKAVGGNHGAKDTALHVLLAEDYVRFEVAGAAHHHHSVRPYREDDDEGAES